MHHVLNIVLIFFTLCVLVSCAGPDRSGEFETAMLPLPPAPVTDPGDAALAKTIKSFIKKSNAPPFSMYEFTRLDLDDDGRRDALVLFKNPYGFWCDMHGCTMLVMKAHDKGFTLVNAIQPVRGPVYVSEEQTNGWKDIMIRISGRWNESKDVVIRFDGAQYPHNPSALPADSLRLAMNDALKALP